MPLVEIASWRIATELLRRYPDRFRLTETHPCDGLYDCLSIVPIQKAVNGASSSAPRIDLNRAGSAHIWSIGGYERWEDIWDRCTDSVHMKMVVDRLCQLALLEEPAALPASTRPVVVYLCITTFLTGAALGRAKWECRNGYCSNLWIR